MVALQLTSAAVIASLAISHGSDIALLLVIPLSSYMLGSRYLLHDFHLKLISRSIRDLLSGRLEGRAPDSVRISPSSSRGRRPTPNKSDTLTRTAITQRIIAHVTRGWPRLGEPIVRHRGQFWYVSAVLPGHREPTPILRLRYQGSAGRRATGIYLASTGQYTESELPATFGPATGTPEQGVDDTFALYAGPESDR